MVGFIVLSQQIYQGYLCPATPRSGPVESALVVYSASVLVFARLADMSSRSLQCVKVQVRAGLCLLGAYFDFVSQRNSLKNECGQAKHRLEITKCIVQCCVGSMKATIQCCDRHDTQCPCTAY